MTDVNTAQIKLSLRDIPDSIGLYYLRKNVSLRKKQRACAFVSGRYINALKFFKGKPDKVIIRGEVHPSQRKSDPCHLVNIEVNTVEKVVTDAYCKCQQGQDGACSHIVAVLLAIEQLKIQGYKEVPALLTCTSLPQQWDKPRGEKITAEPVSQMVLSKPTNVQRKRRPIMANFVDNRKISIEEEDIKALKKLKFCSISYLTEENISTSKQVDTLFGQVPIGAALAYHGPLLEPINMPRQKCSKCGEICFPKELKEDELKSIEDILDGQYDHWREVSLALTDAICIEIETRGQNGSKKWHEERQKRVTASNFGAIMIRQKAVNEKFMTNTFNNKNLLTKPTSYGHVNERVAKKMYISKTNFHLHEIGLVINPHFPFLGASPDAIVCGDGESGILEVKCPYSARDMTINEAINDVKGFFLEKNDNTIALKRNHKHFYQVQGQLMITGAPFCDFVVYTRQDLFIERILPDHGIMLVMLKKLMSFYIDHFKTFISPVLTV